MHQETPNFHTNQIHVQDTKGQNARITILPVALKESLERHHSKVKLLHEEDLAEGFGEVYLPYAMTSAQFNNYSVIKM